MNLPGLYEVYQYLEKSLSEKRFVHCVSTAAFAKVLASKFSGDEERAFFSGLVHDIARELPEERILLLSEGLSGPDSDYYHRHPLMLHGQAGAEILKSEFGIDDRIILDSVRWHVYGHPSMDETARIVYIADYIESTRIHVSAKDRRMIFGMDLNHALLYVLELARKFYRSQGLKNCRDSDDLYSQLKGLING